VSFVAQLRDAAARVGPAFLARARASAAEIAALQTARLRELLACAAERSPFYSERLRGIDTARCRLDDLARIEPVTKAEMMGELDRVFTDRRLTRALAEDALARTRDAPVPIVDRYIAQATGGSSGVRGVFVSDPEAWAEMSGAPLRALAAATGGTGPPPPMVVAMIAAATPVHSTGLVAAVSAGTATIVSLPVTLPLAEIVARLNETRPRQVIGYPSVLARLAREQTTGRLAIAPELVGATSEMLTPDLRAAIRAGFGAPIVDVFGTTEGLFGGTLPDDPVFTFNSDTCIVELVDAGERPVPPGAASDHVLVTNLANRVQPLIRYRIDDRFTRHPSARDHGHLRATVEGRADEIFRFGDVEIHPLVIRAVLLKHPEIVDYQVRQTARGVEATIVAAAETCAQSLGAELRSALADAGLAKPSAVVTLAAALARNPETGKLRRFVPLPH
jgi:phenylacetate-CoA ligase